MSTDRLAFFRESEMTFSSIDLLCTAYVCQTPDRSTQFTIVLISACPHSALDSMPTMKQLRMHVVPHIAAEWETFADVLLDSASATSQLRANYHTVAEKCAEMFRLWLRHANPQWRDLLKVLRSLGHVTLSARLQKTISQGELE